MLTHRCATSAQSMWLLPPLQGAAFAAIPAVFATPSSPILPPCADCHAPRHLPTACYLAPHCLRPPPALGMKDHLRPDGKPAPPRPRSPLFFISSTIQSAPFTRMSLVRYQSPRFSAPCSGAGGCTLRSVSRRGGRQQRAGHCCPDPTRPAPTRRLQALSEAYLDERVMATVNISENAVLVLQTSKARLLGARGAVCAQATSCIWHKRKIGGLREAPEGERLAVSQTERTQRLSTSLHHSPALQSRHGTFAGTQLKHSDRALPRLATSCPSVRTP